MFIGKEMAMAMAEGRKRFISVYQGRALCFMPFQVGTRFVGTHYVPELKRSLICEGEGQCRYHHLKVVAKLHVAALVFRNAFAYSQREGQAVPGSMEFSPAFWTMKIVELTESCFACFQGGAEDGTLASIARKPGRVNGEVEFRWLHGRVLLHYPDAPLSVEEVLPAVIRGTLYPIEDVAPAQKQRKNPRRKRGAS